MDIKARIAHLSDLHFKHNSSILPFLFARDALLGLEYKPDLIIVTGDLVDNSDVKLRRLNIDILKLKKSIRKAYAFLIGLCNKLGVPKSKLIIVPGNHDIRIFGNKYSKESDTLFRKQFAKFSKPKIFKKLGILIFPFNSNITNAKVEFATGEILGKEFKRCNSYLLKTKNSMPKNEFHKITQIAILHHHPMPIPAAEHKKDIGTRRIKFFKDSTDQEKFLILNNSGTFMSEVLRHNFRLILHGHKHYEGVSKASYPIGNGAYKTVAIVSAGSVGEPTAEKKYSFNIIDITEDDRISVDYYERKEEASFTNTSKSLEIFSKEESKRSNFESSMDGIESIARTMVINDFISGDNGDFLRNISLKKWAPTKNNVNIIKSEIKSSSGLFVKSPEIKITEPSGYNAKWSPIGTPKDGLQEGRFKIEPHFLKEDPLNAEITIEIPNAISFSKEERRSFTSEEFERNFRRFEHISAKKAIWNIYFPPGYDFDKPRISVHGENYKSLSYEKIEAEKNLCYSKNLNSISTLIEHPNPENTYQISWDLPSKDKDLKKNNFSDKTISETHDIIEYFRELKSEDSMNGNISEFLNCIYETITNMEVLNGKFKGKPLEIALSFFNEDADALQYAAFLCPHCEDILNATIWNHKSLIGHPVNGLVYKSKDVCFKCFDTPKTKTYKQYIRKSACKDNDKHLRSFFGIPLMYPITSRNVIAVLELATCSKHKMLFQFSSSCDNPVKRYTNIQFISNKANILFNDHLKKEKLI